MDQFAELFASVNVNCHSCPHCCIFFQQQRTTWTQAPSFSLENSIKFHCLWNNNLLLLLLLLLPSWTRRWMTPSRNQSRHSFENSNIKKKKFLSSLCSLLFWLLFALSFRCAWKVLETEKKKKGTDATKFFSAIFAISFAAHDIVCDRLSLVCCSKHDCDHRLVLIKSERERGKKM